MTHNRPRIEAFGIVLDKVVAFEFICDVHSVDQIYIVRLAETNNPDVSEEVATTIYRTAENCQEFFTLVYDLIGLSLTHAVEMDKALKRTGTRTETIS
jgi:hypothetical protein